MAGVEGCWMTVRVLWELCVQVQSHRAAVPLLLNSHGFNDANIISVLITWKQEPNSFFLFKRANYYRAFFFHQQCVCLCCRFLQSETSADTVIVNGVCINRETVS